MSARPVPDGEYAGLPGADSLLVHIDDDREPEDDGGALAGEVTVGGTAPEAERAEESRVLGGYPELTGRELAKPDEPADGADAEGADAEGADAEGASAGEDDGVLHTESRELESLGLESVDE